MKTHVLSLLTGTALIATIGIAQAAEPMTLSENQMDQVTAGVNVSIAGPTTTTFAVGGVQFTITGGNVTIPLS